MIFKSTPKRVWAVCCGLIRDIKEFESTINFLLQARDRGVFEEIVVSTWFGLLEHETSLAEWLRKNRVIVVESQAPVNKTPGNIMHQFKVLEHGLAACPDDAHILKCRTDKSGFDIPEDHPDYFQLENLLKICSFQFRKPVAAGSFPSVFKDRIYVKLGRLTYPFYIKDIVFFGYKADLQQLINYSFKLGIKFGHFPNSAEIYFFSGPFLSRFPILSEYFFRANPTPRRKHNNDSPHRYDDEDMAKIVEAEMSTEFFLEAMATYLHILHRFFWFGLFLEEQPFRDDTVSILDIFKGCPEPYVGPGWTEVLQSAAVLDQRLIEGLVQQTFKQDAWSERFTRALKKTGSWKYHKTYRIELLDENTPGARYQRCLQETMRCPKPLLALHDPTGKVTLDGSRILATR